MTEAIDENTPSLPRVRELVSAVIGATDVDAWAGFLTALLDVMPRWNEDRTELRTHLDEEGPARLIVRRSVTNGLLGLQWAVEDGQSLQALARSLASSGLEVSPGSSPEAGSETFSFRDPLGVEHEFCARPRDTAGATPAHPSRFVTGDQGFGHAVFHVDDVDKYDRIYREGLGMSLREDMTTLVGTRGRFYGCSPRHHSIALVEASEPGARLGVMHLMLEMSDLDSVGTALDSAKSSSWKPRTELGRHRTDNMVSFYVPTPAGFDFEIGCSGLRVDDSTWPDVKESTRKIAWGHGGVASQGSP